MTPYKKWYEANKDRARAQKREIMKRLRKENPEKYASHCRESQRRLKHSLYNVYGHKCALCGFEDKRALTLDHIKNNGAQERAEFGERGVYRRALKPENYLEYRILCMNCQFIARHQAGRQNQHKRSVLLMKHEPNE
jgi:ribosomal protein L37E